MKALGAKPASVGRLLGTTSLRRASGIVHATRGKLKRLFCLEGGYLAYAASNVIEEQFVEHLVRRGLLTRDAADAAVAEAARSSRKIAVVLRELPSPGAETMRRSMEALVEELVASTLEWPDGGATFSEGLPKLDGEVTVRVSPVALLLRHARRFPASLHQVRVRIGPPDLRPVQTDHADSVLEMEALDDVARHVVRASDGSADLTAIVAGSPGDEDATLRAVYALITAGAIEPLDPKERLAGRRRSKDAPLSREECLARLSGSAGGDHYVVLGISSEASQEAVREAYYVLARRYHPDRFRAGDLQDLLPRFEAFFAQVTEAYNTLIDPDRRAEYDESLAAPADAEGPKQSESSYLARQNYLRGRALVQQRKSVEAVQFLENAVQLDGMQPDYHRELGLLLVRNARRREDAERHLLRASELAPAQVAPYVALAGLYQRAGKLVAASRMVREALRWEPDHAEAKDLAARIGDVPDDGSPTGPVFSS